jgi:S-adenosylmethionine-diacylglycerol 3-amino-3-carboxypropyl transferase
MEKKMDKISYAQCWEDPDVLIEGLNISDKDTVLSIASGGDNTFALLLKNPKQIIAVDQNPAQVYLVELKMKAIQLFDYSDFIEFIGVRSSDKRRTLYHKIRSFLSKEARDYWDSHSDSIDLGIIHCGKFEQYFSIFRKYILSLIHKPDTIAKLFQQKEGQDQYYLYHTKWNTRRWRFLYRVFFGKLLLGHLGRHPSYFKYVEGNHIAAELFRRTQFGLTEIQTHSNYFLEYIMTGNYSNIEQSHPYFRSGNFEILKRNICKIQLIHDSVERLIKKIPKGTVSKFNLSDIFEYMSFPDYLRTIDSLIEICGSDARIAFWTLFVPRRIPLMYRTTIEPQKDLSEDLSNNAKTFFYGDFNIWQVDTQSSVLDTRWARSNSPLRKGARGLYA